MNPMGLTLRRILSGVTISLGTVTIAVCILLVWMTTELRRIGDSANTNLMSVRLTQEIKVDLLILERARDTLVRSEMEADLVRHLAEAHQYVTSHDEQHALAIAEVELHSYLDHVRRTDLPQDALTRAQDTVFRALDSLAALNVAQTEESRRAAVRLDMLSNLLGMTLGTLLLLTVVVSLWLLRFRWLQPIVTLGESMRRFAQDKSTRARDSGPAEVRHLAQSFNEMAAELSQQSERRTAFLAGVAHDLRNPLSALKISTAIVAPNCPLPSEERIRQVLALVQRQVERLDRMVWDFLDAARIDAGILDVRTEACDLRQLATGIVDLYGPVSPAHRITLTGLSEPLIAHCDPMRIEQVLGNLVSNAIRYSPRGGAIEVGILQDGDEAILSVADFGIGMTPEQMEHLFEPFSRATKESIPGTGLGLFVARRIVEVHGGRIEVRSTYDRGSTFTVRLPLTQPSRERGAVLTNSQPSMPALA